MNSKLIWFTAAATALALPSMPAGELPTNGVRRACCCRSDGTAATTLSDGTRTACCRSAETAATTLSDKSLYQLDSTWTNDAGASLKLASLKGRPQLVCMFFANCQYACPLLVYKMKQLEAALPENLRNNIGFLLVSFDTERDTPAVLHEYRVNHELAPGRWNLLHGSPGTFGLAGRQIQERCSRPVHALQPAHSLKSPGGNRLSGDSAGPLRGAPCPKAEATIILARTAQRVTGSQL